jgi:flagellar biosynthesis protein FliQ
MIQEHRIEISDFDSEIVNYLKEVAIIKQMAQIDKKRLGFIPEEGENQYTRNCQNSGNDKKRRPLQTIQSNIENLISKGYQLNKKTGEYEKKILLKSKGKKDGEMILKAIKVTDQDEISGLANDIYYSCDPADNGEHMYIGFLTRSNNPFGECMPCCFKKNPLISKKKDKQEFYKKCLEPKLKDSKNQPTNTFTGDILYILQDTNKIQDGRIGYLPKFLDLITMIYIKDIY